MRRRRYAQCTAALIRRPGPGRASVFAQALNNGLASIVAFECPGKLPANARKTPSARKLLGTIVGIGQEQADGAVLVPIAAGFDPASEEHLDRVLGPPKGTSAGVVRVNVPRLRAAIDATDAARHARAASADTPDGDAIEALVALDQHPALRVLDDELQDQHEDEAMLADQAEKERAADYWASLPDEERTRRRSLGLAQGARASATKIAEPVEPSDCPVCRSTELTVERVSDAFGLGFGPGVCLACGYRRSEEVAEWLAIDLVLGRDDEDHDPWLVAVSPDA